MSTPPLYAGIEAGGTKFNCVLGHASGEIIARATYPTSTPDETLAQVTEFFLSGNQTHRQVHGPLRALGIASFGPVDLDQQSPTYGYITTTPKPSWANTNLLGQLQSALNIPAAFDTDVNGAALGEATLGAAQNLKHFIYVTIGTGVGAGVIVNGQPVNGSSHPEIGHWLIPHHPDDHHFPGSCPFHGKCLEGLVAGPALRQRWGQSAEKLPENHPAWERQAYYLAALCMNLTLAYSPERILLGGGVMQQAHLFPLVRTRFRQLLNGYGRDINALEQYIQPPALGNHAGEIGSLLLAERALFATHRTQ